jgi:hypothetical protein
LLHTPLTIWHCAHVIPALEFEDVWLEIRTCADGGPAASIE